MPRQLRSFLSVSVLTLALSVAVFASTPFTPDKWQQVVEKHSNAAFVGQRKHITWIRDQNRNFIDDEIEKRFHSGQTVNVVVDMNTCLPTKEIEEILGKYGKVKYIGKLITFVLLDEVPFDELPKLAARPEVAMIEWRAPVKLMNDVSTRAVQARSSVTYSPNTAEDHGFTGTGVNVAIIDTGVDDTHEAFAGKFVAGFNALDPTDPGDGSRHPGDDNGHGTHVAGTALGRETSGRTCRTPTDHSPTNCGGVAPGAGLVVVKVCDASGNCPGIQQGIDWVGTHAATFHIRVANMSFGDCVDDDGTSAMSQQVNYLAAIGVVPSVAHGNSPNCGVSAGTRRTQSPGSASFAITVNSSDDQGTVTRTDDTISLNFYMIGPRVDFNLMSPNLLALKPDITAPGGRSTPSGGTDGPGFDIWSACSASAGSMFSSCLGTSTMEYHQDAGTSMSAPHVTGAAADIIQARNTIDPGSLKDLLLRTADSSRNFTQGGASEPTISSVWNNAFGYGILNVWNAINAGAATDVGFPTCIGPPVTPGGLCALGGGLPAWDNSVDITTTSPPKAGVPNTVTAQIKNFGGVPATVLVNFGAYVFAVGNNQFFHLGTVQVTVGPGMTVPVSQSWTPQASNHQCIQVSIAYGLDTNYGNNVTQRNFTVAPSVFKVRVENPFMVPARFEVRVKSRRDDWKCTADVTTFTMGAFDCPHEMQVEYVAPVATKPGEHGDCDVGVYATPQGTEKPVLIGGVTVETLMPKPCRFVGTVLSAAHDEPLAGAVLLFEAVNLEGERMKMEPVKTQTDGDGTFTVVLEPYRHYRVLIEKEGVGRGEVSIQPLCGDCLTFVLDQKTARAASRCVRASDTLSASQP